MNLGSEARDDTGQHICSGLEDPVRMYLAINVPGIKAHYIFNLSHAKKIS